MSEKFNVDIAIEHLEKQAQGVSQHKCATYVRQALEAGGLKFKHHPPENAKDYGQTLIENGFRRIGDPTPYFQKGDIAVIQNYPGGRIAGHITMYTGRIWISDFRQRDMWSGPGYREAKPAYTIYRLNMP